MGSRIIDTLGLKDTESLLQMALATPNMKPGNILEVWGDCPAFEENVQVWCERLGKMILSIENDGGSRRKIKIRF